MEGWILNAGLDFKWRVGFKCMVGFLIGVCFNWGVGF
jgi:hypothetical protein